MTGMTNAPLACPGCAAPLTATEVLEACSVSHAETGLLRFQCPSCGAAALARLEDRRLELGETHPPGGSAFRPTAIAAEPELFVRREPAWVDCWHGKVYRRFPVDVG